jgi:hypothetical protein
VTKEKIKQIPLKIYILSHSLMKTEFLALLGDKYRAALPEGAMLVNRPDEANVIGWDGLLTPKLKPDLLNFIEANKDQKIFLILGSYLELTATHASKGGIYPDESQIVSIPRAHPLPEELLAALIECHKKINHV